MFLKRLATLTPHSGFSLMMKLFGGKGSASFSGERMEVVTQRCSYRLHQLERVICVHAKLGQPVPVAE